MIVSVETYLRRGIRQLHRLMLRPGVRLVVRFLGCWTAGFFLSAAGLAHASQPLAMGLCASLSGWRVGAAALGSMLGYRFFWGSAGTQGIVWTGLGAILGLIPRNRQDFRFPLLLPVAAAFGVSAAGLAFQLFFKDDTTFGLYLLRVCTGALSPLLFSRQPSRREPIRQWLRRGAGVLALAQAAPVIWLNMGVVLCALTVCTCPLPGAVLAGLALDLARITPLSMTAVSCTAFFLGLIPVSRKWARCLTPAAAALLLMPLQASWDLYLLPALVLGGALGWLLPRPPGALRVRGGSGFAQVRLEVTAGVLTQLQQLLLEANDPPVAEEELLAKARDRACGSCVLAKTCRERKLLAPVHLHRPTEFACRRPARIQMQLQLCREQLYAMRLSRSRRAEYRDALVQQYQFLSACLRELADQLPGRPDTSSPRFRIRISSRCRSKDPANGDRCTAFPGTRCRYYVLLCDGMGSGLGAADNAQTVQELLQPLLSAGFPAEHALRSINSILALRGQAGAATLDLAEIRLDTGKARLYKWGAAPSYLVGRKDVQILGSASPPPGIRLESLRETVLPLTLNRGETLVMLSDGVCTREFQSPSAFSGDLSPSALAEALLKLGSAKGEDDATVAVIRLEPRLPHS